jgi:hypothetical protein
MQIQELVRYSTLTAHFAAELSSKKLKMKLTLLMEVRSGFG